MYSMGACQGDSLSPLLFALSENDFTRHVTKVYHGLNITDTCHPSLRNEGIICLMLFGSTICGHCHTVRK